MKELDELNDLRELLDSCAQKMKSDDPELSVELVS